jgi:cytochrome b
MRALVKWAVLAAVIAVVYLAVMPRVRAYQAEAKAETECRRRCEQAAMTEVDECMRDMSAAAVVAPAACLAIVEESSKRCREECEKR